MRCSGARPRGPLLENSIAQRKRLVAGVGDVEPLEAQVFQGSRMGARHRGPYRSLELESEAPSSINDEGIQLGAVFPRVVEQLDELFPRTWRRRKD